MQLCYNIIITYVITSATSKQNLSRDLLELQERSAAAEWRLGAAGEGLASFAGWQTAALNVLKRTLPGPQGLVGAAGKVCRGLSGAWECRGLSGAWELQGSVWRVLRAGKRQP